MFNKNAKNLKTCLTTSLFALTILLAKPVTAYASMGGHGDSHGPVGIDSLLWPAVNFTIFFFLMVHFYRKFAKPVLRDYRNELESNVMRQKNEHSMLQSELEQLQERLANISDEKQEIVSELEKDGRDLSAVIFSSANQQAESAASSGKRRYDLEIKKVSSEARKTLMERVLNKVKSQVLNSFSAEDDAKLIRSSVENDLVRIFNRD